MRTRLVLLSLASLAYGFAACGGDDVGVAPPPGDAGTHADASTGDAPAPPADAPPSGTDAPAPGTDAPAPTDAGTDAPAAPLAHVFYFMMENHGYAEIIGNTGDAPYINQLASQYGVATSYFGVTHPSLPNYLAAVSGDFQGIWDDCKAGQAVTCAPEEFVPGAGDGTTAELLTDAQVASATAQPHWFTGNTIVDQLETKGLGWKAYMQTIPGVGATDEYAPVDVVDGSMVPRNLYAQKHDPFMYFANVRGNAARMQRIVPLTQLDTDLGAAATTPSFVWVSPDQCHDMHGVSTDNANAVGIPTCAYPATGLDHGAIALGDAFLQTYVQKIMQSPAWSDASAIVIVWDEDDYEGNAGCCGSPTNGGDGGVLGGAGVPAIVITSKHAKHQTLTDPFNHYSLLATIQQIFGLGCLANTCGMTGNQLMTKLFLP